MVKHPVVNCMLHIKSMIHFGEILVIVMQTKIDGIWHVTKYSGKCRPSGGMRLL